jgi:hypothetical protein
LIYIYRERIECGKDKKKEIERERKEERKSK